MNVQRILILACGLIFVMAGCINESGFGVGLAPDQYERNNEYPTAEEYAANDGYETDDDFSSGNAIAPGVPQDHTFHYDQDTDFILLDLTDITPPMIVTIETSFFSMQTDTQLFLYDGDRKPIEYDDNGGENGYSRIVWMCDDASTYYVQVDQKNNRIGDYRITVTYTVQITDITMDS